MDECLKYFKAIIADPSSVPSWADWWLHNAELVRSQFSREDYLRLKFRKVEAAYSILVERGLVLESTISPHLRDLSNKHGSLLSGFPDLNEHFQSVFGNEFQNREEFEVNLLSYERCVDLTEDFATFHPLFQAPEIVQFLILDDANTSDHHCFVFDLPYPGSILFLPHDDEMRIAFRSLKEFETAMRSAINTGQRLTKFHMKEVLLSLDQVKLDAAIRSGLETNDSVPVSLLIQSSDLGDLDFFLSIAGLPDWTYAEQIANRIVANPLPYMRPIADKIAQHELERVSEKGKQAIRAIDSLSAL